MNYDEFLKGKQKSAPYVGFECTCPEYLYPFQKVIFDRACVRGRSAVFADCGLGKTPIQLAWANAVYEQTSKNVLIVSPLAVAEQTSREGEKFGVKTNVCRKQADAVSGINITNYEMMKYFDPELFAGIVLDESSILKSYSGKVRREITDFAESVYYRLAATATPAPNDYIELVNHSEFLGVMSGKEAIALFFRQESNSAHEYRIKKHAESDWWAWLSSWATACRNPEDMGYVDSRFTLPCLNVVQHVVGGHTFDDYLFPVDAMTLDDQRKASKKTTKERCKITADMVNADNNPWVVWCYTNSESEELSRLIPDAVEVRGSDSVDNKAERMLGFSSGKYRVIVTKPSIAGFGMNWQHCSNVAFVGISHSYEQYYQAIRRCWRFGQKNTVNAHIVCTENDGPVLNNIERKDMECRMMMDKLVKYMNHKYIYKKDDLRYIATDLVQTPEWL